MISVIIPCFNHEKYVEKSIESIFSQTYKNFELIVIDDGSTDGSVDVLKRLQNYYDFILIVQENMGVCKTLNRAIREFSSGAYIALLASDDFWHKDKLELQMFGLLSRPDVHFSFTQAIEFTDENRPYKGRIFPRKCISGSVLKSVFLRQHVPAGSMLFSRELFDRLDGFDEHLREEDWDFVIRAASITDFFAVASPLLFYRSHALNTMKTSGRPVIFQQKMKILSKNMNLVGPWRGLYSVLIHLSYDMIYKRFF